MMAMLALASAGVAAAVPNYAAKFDCLCYVDGSPFRQVITVPAWQVNAEVRIASADSEDAAYTRSGATLVNVSKSKGVLTLAISSVEGYSELSITADGMTHYEGRSHGPHESANFAGNCKSEIAASIPDFLIDTRTVQ